MAWKVFTNFNMSLGIAKVIKFRRYSFSKEFVILSIFNWVCLSVFGFNCNVQLFHDFFFKLHFLLSMHHNCFGGFKLLFRGGFYFFPKHIFLGDTSTLSFCPLGPFELFESEFELELNDDNLISSTFLLPLGL